MPLVAADVGCWKLNCVVLDPGYTAGEQRITELSTSLPKFHNHGEGRRPLHFHILESIKTAKCGK